MDVLQVKLCFEHSLYQRVRHHLELNSVKIVHISVRAGSGNMSQGKLNVVQINTYTTTDCSLLTSSSPDKLSTSITAPSEVRLKSDKHKVKVK